MNRMAIRLCSLSLAAAGLLASSTPAAAYRMIQNTSTGRTTSGSAVTCNDPGGFAHWNLCTIPWRLNTSGQGSGKTAAVQNALSAWNAVAGTQQRLSYAGTTTAGWSTDGVNTMVWASASGCGTGCLAITALVLQSGQVIVESDIAFNPNYTWRTNGADQDTQAVATHELGHSLGIHHTEVTGTPRPTMYQYYQGTASRSLENDDRAARQCSENTYCPSCQSLSVSLSCNDYHVGSLQVWCLANASGARYPRTYSWSYTGDADFFSSNTDWGAANYYYGCPYGGQNNFSVTVTDACGQASAYAYPDCWESCPECPE